HRRAHGLHHRRADLRRLPGTGGPAPAQRAGAGAAEPHPQPSQRRNRPVDHAGLGGLPEHGEPMTPTRAPKGFVLLVVLAAAAVLSLIAAFIYTRTEDQLILSVAAQGQTIASTRATLAAERKLALYRANYPINVLNPLAAVPTYAQAQNPLPPIPPVPQIGDRELADYEAVALPAAA